MTTHAPSRPAAPEVRAPTTPLHVEPGSRRTDSLKLLDNRSRKRAVPAQLARRGPHLALRENGQDLLIALESKITHIGRGVSSDIRIDDQTVSTSHAIIVRYGRYARVLDNRSSNGTFLNGRRVVATNLRNADVLWIGPVAMRYVEVT